MQWSPSVRPPAAMATRRRCVHRYAGLQASWRLKWMSVARPPDYKTFDRPLDLQPRTRVRPSHTSSTVCASAACTHPCAQCIRAQEVWSPIGARVIRRVDEDDHRQSSRRLSTTCRGPGRTQGDPRGACGLRRRILCRGNQTARSRWVRRSGRRLTARSVHVGLGFESEGAR